MSKDVPKTHPRYESLMTRERIVEGVEKGITSLHGLIAQGRGEAWDYLIKEKTNEFAYKAIEVAAAMLILAKHPVISINGNTASLVPEEIIKLGKTIPAKIEVNIFHTSKDREEKIKQHLIKHGAKEVLMPSQDYTISFIDHNRKYVNKNGIYKADVVFVPLEDGDRCEALVKNGKKVITIDLNPLSRTAKTSTITIVDNITRAVKELAKKIEEIKNKNKKELDSIVRKYDNTLILKQAREEIIKNLQYLER